MDYTQGGEQKYILDELKHIKKGTFLDVGAYDGVGFSNTRSLALSGWGGFLVEPHPVHAEKCRQLYADRSDIKVIEAAVAESDGWAEMFTNDTYYSSLSQEETLRWKNNKSIQFKKNKVPIFSLSSLCAANGITHVDFVSLDAEGYDWIILQQLMESTLRPQLICVEHNGKIYNQCLQLLTQNGYEFVYRTAENLLVHKKEHKLQLNQFMASFVTPGPKYFQVPPPLVGKRKIVFKYTTRSRPEKFERGLRTIIEKASGESDLAVLVTIDEDDKTMSAEWVEQCFAKLKPCEHIVDVGKSTGKINAINRGLELLKHFEPWHILVNMSDDMVFTRDGYDKIIASNTGEDTFLHLPDGHQNANLSTMTIEGKKYFDRFGYIYHPSYISLWCDVEAQDVAKKLNCYRFVNELVFEHLHPIWKKAEMDDQYRATEDWLVNKKDHDTYLKRSKCLKLSILIPSVKERKLSLDRLLANIKEHAGGFVENQDYEVLVDVTEPYKKGGPTTGAKRNKLLQAAKGKYVMFIDDDDLVINTGIELIILATDKDCDMIGINGFYQKDGEAPIPWFQRKDNEYKTVPAGFLRPPNHLTPTLREIAKTCSFPNSCKGEDAAYGRELTPKIKTETIVETPVYNYLFSSTNKLYSIW